MISRMEKLEIIMAWKRGDSIRKIACESGLSGTPSPLMWASAGVPREESPLAMTRPSARSCRGRCSRRREGSHSQGSRVKQLEKQIEECESNTKQPKYELLNQ